MRAVSAVGVGMTRFGKLPGRSLRSLATEAAEGALIDAGVLARDVDYVFFANAIGGLVTGQEMMRGQVALAGLDLGGRPLLNVENACASGASAVHLAFNVVAAGAAACVLVVGAETMSSAERSVVFAAIGAAMDLERAPEELGGRSVGEISQTRSPFVDLYAISAFRYMERSGASVDDLATVSAKNHRNGAMNPNAQYGLGIGVSEVLGSPLIVDPLTRLMCAPLGDGAAAVVLCRSDSDVARSGRAVPVLASELVSCAMRDGRPPQAEAARRAYRVCGIAPSDIDFAEVHDATAVAELIAYEELGFAGQGRGAELLRSGATEKDGSIPVNASGGLLSKGHPIGATGVAQIVEIVEQLRGEAGGRQLARRRLGLAANQGGWIAGQPAVAAVHILGEPAAF